MIGKEWPDDGIAVIPVIAAFVDVPDVTRTWLFSICCAVNIRCS